jgi:hypothetical protein
VLITRYPLSACNPFESNIRTGRASRNQGRVPKGPSRQGLQKNYRRQSLHLPMVLNSLPVTWLCNP